MSHSYRPYVIVTRRLPEPVETELKEQFEVRLNTADRVFSSDELGAALRTADGLLPAVTDRLTAEVLAVEPLKTGIIANFGVGYNNIDVEAARARGVVVTNTPDVLTEDTADIALTLLLAVARRTGEGERQLRAGKWTGWGPMHMLGTRVGGKTLGVVGLGRIGRAVARRARHGFGMKIQFYTPSAPPPELVSELDAERRETLEELLSDSDFISLHCPSTPETRHLINAERLAQMRKSAYLINTARGDVVDESALAEALASGAIAGAGLDVYEREPAVNPKLLKMENVVLLPHLGSATQETRVAMGMRALDNLAAFFRGEPPPDRVA
jgi:lactate dehydrogenase-like 2-hydroxyacid dehydrogenase